jgi:hypothetical protein
MQDGIKEQTIQEFLSWLRAKGPWVLTAIVPDGPTTTETFTAIKSLLAWVHNQNVIQRKNVYYTLNPLRGTMDRKPKKTDITAAEFTHLDADPSPEESPEQFRARFLPVLKAFNPAASAVVDSGNGIQVLWRLDGQHENATAVELVNRALLAEFNAQSGTQNIDRLLRLPGTINYPNAAKLKAGRTARLSSLLECNDKTYALTAFPELKQEERRGPGRPSGSKNKSKEIPAYLTSILLLPDNGAGQRTGDYETRSDALFAFLRLALSRGIDENEIIAAVLDDKYEGCAVYEHTAPQGRDYLKRQIERAANYSDESGNKRIIKVEGGKKHEHWRATQQALMAARTQVFVRAERLVEPLWRLEEDERNNRSVLLMKFVPYNLSRLEDQVARHAVEYQRYNKTSNKWLRIDPPTDIITALLYRGDWAFESVVGITNTPTLRRDGSLLDAPGYDRVTKLWYKPVPGFTLPPISDSPTKEEATAALELLLGLIDEFPFTDGDTERTEADINKGSKKGVLSRTVVLAGMMTPVLRGAFKVAPIFLFRKPEAGTGGSYLVDLISTLATGRTAPPLKVSDDKNELQKELSAAASEARPILNLNNISFNLRSSDLAQMVTEGTLLIRPFGKNDETRLCDCSAMTIFVNGNNIVVVGELVRRTLTARLDAKSEYPERRTFRHRPVDEVAADRGKYLAAIFTIFRAYAAAGKPDVKAEPLASFEEWSEIIRHPLMWLGLPDPVESMKDARMLDPERGELSSRIKALLEVFGGGASGEEFTAADINRKILETVGSGPYGKPKPLYPDLLMAFAMTNSGIPMNAKAIGNQLRADLGRVVDGYSLVIVKESAHGHRYKLIGPDYNPWGGDQPTEDKPQPPPEDKPKRPPEDKPKPYTEGLQNLRDLCAELKPLMKQPRWAPWRWELEGGDNWKLFPYQPRRPGLRAKFNNLKDWGKFEDAVDEVNAKHAWGIVFNLLDSGFAAIHLDKCRPGRKEVEPWAKAILDRAPENAYVETTPSGAGLNIIGTTINAALNRNFDIGDGRGIGLYRSARGILITGLGSLGYWIRDWTPLVRRDGPLANIDSLIDALLAEYDKEAAAEEAREEPPRREGEARKAKPSRRRPTERKKKV